MRKSYFRIIAIINTRLRTLVWQSIGKNLSDKQFRSFQKHLNTLYKISVKIKVETLNSYSKCDTVQ